MESGIRADKETQLRCDIVVVVAMSAEEKRGDLANIYIASTS
jgi:hypothetical protein